MWLARNQGGLIAFRSRVYPGMPEPIGVVIPLGCKDRFLGRLALLADPATIKEIAGEISQPGAFAPLMAGEERVGVLNAVNKLEDRPFDRDDEQILSAIADEVALAVKNARLFDFVVDSSCKIRQGQNSCKGCKRPLKSWTPCAKQLAC